MASQVAGRVAELRVTEGDTVTRGQLLAVITPDELMAERTVAAHNTRGLASQVREAVRVAEVTEYGDAINAYTRITNNFPTNPIAARAMGACQ